MQFGRLEQGKNIDSGGERPRNYSAEQEARAIRRSRADHHPLSSQSLSPSPLNQDVVVVANRQDNDFFDPLRGGDNDAVVLNEDALEFENAATVSLSAEATSRIPSKEWTSFKRFLMQKFPVSKMISLSSMPDVIIKRGKEHIEELNDLQKDFDDDAKVITQHEYVSRLHELKDEIMCAWNAEDRGTALKLSIKVAKLLVDTSVQQFYPTLFVLVTDVMDMLGDMVWKRIRQKAEFAEDGAFLSALPENFKASDVCSDAKEVCYNWFCKVGSIRELLPRIYLELALLPCWCFLLDNPADNLQRLVMMVRGLADPLASAYCRLYMVHCARKLPTYGKGYLVRCVDDIKFQLNHLFSAKEAPNRNPQGKLRLLVNLIEPTIEHMMKCMFEDASQREVDLLLLELGLRTNQVGLPSSSPCVSIVLHNLLKELPTEVVSSKALDIMHLIKCSNDYSLDQCLNYRLLGFRLGEGQSQMDIINSAMDEVIQVIAQYDKLDEYLKIAEAYIDIILQNQMEKYLNTLLDGVYTRVCNKDIIEDEQGNLQSILLKLLSHFKDLDNVFALKHFLDILDVLYGNPRNVIDVHILKMATRDGQIRDTSAIQLLFEISQSLHNGIDFANIKDDFNQHAAHMISRFVELVDYGAEMDQHLTFLVECRGAFGSINELKESLVHLSNYLATKALKDGNKRLTFVKSCVAFSEVTIPSISAQIKKLNLYLETAEVAFLSGLISHADGLIVSAISCLEKLDYTDGLWTPTNVDGILSSIRKLCSLLVMVPGISAEGITKFPRNIVSLLNSTSWMTPRTKTKTFCGIILLLATLSQNKLPYHAYYSEILGNDMLFYGDSSYVQELISLSNCVLENLVNSIEQEPSKAARGSIALEACNCIALSFKENNDVVQVCAKLIETAKFCLSANDKYLQSTIRYVDEQLSNSRSMPSAA
ncbi:VPS35 endosomal protein-sorting factor-like [Euphorbia peplus]|nr:VPS35 endosomal protein-sorting factor-like [Euphorbia peplus]